MAAQTAPVLCSNYCCKRRRRRLHDTILLHIESTNYSSVGHHGKKITFALMARHYSLMLSAVAQHVVYKRQHLTRERRFPWSTHNKLRWTQTHCRCGATPSKHRDEPLWDVWCSASQESLGIAADFHWQFYIYLQSKTDNHEYIHFEFWVVVPQADWSATEFVIFWSKDKFPAGDLSTMIASDWALRISESKIGGHPVSRQETCCHKSLINDTNYSGSTPYSRDIKYLLRGYLDAMNRNQFLLSGLIYPWTVH